MATIFEIRLEAFLAKPSEDTWAPLAHTIIPGTMRTTWQAWIRVDGGAPVSFPSGARWPSIPDPFTVRRAVNAALAGKVPVGLGALLASRDVEVPR
jgi:hypothetical protein